MDGGKFCGRAVNTTPACPGEMTFLDWARAFDNQCALTPHVCIRAHPLRSDDKPPSTPYPHAQLSAAYSHSFTTT